MKSNKILISAFFAFALTSMTTSCVDDWKFGDSFLEKAPGGDITKDTVFNNAEYTREFLYRNYANLYYGIPFYWRAVDNKLNTGVEEAMSDCYQSHTDWDHVFKFFYSGAYSPGDAGSGKIQCFGYSNSQQRVWSAVRTSYIFLENVDQTPGMDEAEKKRLKAEAKCIIASRYFDMFRRYGSLPIVKKSYSGTDAVYETPRGTVEENVDFMVSLLDEAAPDLPWVLDESERNNWDGRFTRAAAKALKCKILLFAASPLFNNDTPYAGTEADEANQKHQSWYGNFDQARWQKCLEACQDFFKELGSDGYYELIHASGNTPNAYRAAYRKAYSERGTTEMLMGTRVRYNGSGWQDNTFGGHNYLFGTLYNYNNKDNPEYGGYDPTLEFMEMFDWKDGRPFDLDKTLAENPDTMYSKVTVLGSGNNVKYEADLTRDPRLYETMIVNGVNTTMNDNGNSSGRLTETWFNGEDGGNGAGPTEVGQYATGFANNKFYINGDNNRVKVWPYMRLAEMYLIYAEALAQCGQLDEAIKQVNVIRARVGLKGLKESDPSKSWTDKNTVIEAILKERAVELSFEETRLFDMVRYRRSDLFQKPLHGLRMYRVDANGKDNNQRWYGTSEASADPKSYPTHFRFEKFEVAKGKRAWWTNWDNKWFLLGFPPTEINKGYGLTQNPGW